MDANATPESIAALARAYLRARFPGARQAVNVVLRFGPDLDFEGLTVELTCTAGPGPAAGGGEMRGNILQALRKAGVPLTGAKLAEAAGYAYGGSFRSLLAELVREGVVLNHRPGYGLPD
jgi:hypothetical protein